MREIVTSFADAEVVYSQAEARGLLQRYRERQWPGCFVAHGPIPGESTICQSPRELVRVVFSRSLALGLDSPDAGQVK